jgi:hypothetical protein
MINVNNKEKVFKLFDLFNEFNQEYRFCEIITKFAI